MDAHFWAVIEVIHAHNAIRPLLIGQTTSSSSSVSTTPPITPVHPGTIHGAKRSTLLNVVCAIVVLLVSALLTLLLRSQPPNVLITSPTEEARVPILTTVEGTASNIPTNEELWVLIVPNGVTAYFPQSGPVVITGNNWTSSARIGLPSDVGLEFTLIAA